ncbi:Cytochrome P450 [Pyrenophora tritici-repentis]|nr:Cytochrome P450 [Pyrenophora tritici-repentis]
MRLVKQPLPSPIRRGPYRLAMPFSLHLWNPHRWDDRVIEEDDESEMVDYGYGRMSRGTKSAYLPFGGGRHRCIGEKFAYLNLEVITAIMVRNFCFKNLDGREGVPGTDYSTMFSRPLEPAEIVWQRR